MSSSDPLGGDRVDYECAYLLVSLKQGLPLNQELTHWSDCLTDEVQGSICLPSPMLWLQPSTWLFYAVPEDQNWGLMLVQRAVH